MSLQQELAAEDLKNLAWKAFEITAAATVEVAFCALTTSAFSRFTGWYYGLSAEYRIGWFRFALFLQVQFFIKRKETKEWFGVAKTLLTRDAPFEGIAGAEVANFISSSLLLVLYWVWSLGLYYIAVPIKFFFRHWLWILGFSVGSSIVVFLALVVYVRWSERGGRLANYARAEKGLNHLRALPFIIGYGIYNTPFLLVEFMKKSWRSLGKILKPHLERWYLRRPVRLYKYRELNAETKEIRLIQLQKKILGAEISCKFIHIPIDKAPEYEAISYTWGKGGRDHLIFVENKWLPATKNVYKILHDRSTYTKTRYLWIDAVCINQEDMKEKSIQVSMMGLIYSKAERVIVWLDNELINHSELTDANLLLELLYFNALDLSKELYDPPTRVVGLHHHWKALSRLLSHPYWHRVWIVQEIALAKQIHVLYGKKYISWEQLFKMTSIFLDYPMDVVITTALTSYGLNNSIVFRGAAQILFLQASKFSATQGINGGLADCIMLTGRCLATDGRDKIFALKNLFKDAEEEQTSEEAIKVDYTLSQQQTYEHTARYFITRDLDFLLSKAGSGWDRKTKNLPSWVPDFVDLPSSPNDRNLNPEATFKAGLSYKMQIKPYIHSSTIALGVVPISKISHLCPTSICINDEDNPPEVLLKSFNTMHRESWTLASALPSTYKPTGQPLLEAFWRTLIEDRHIIDQPATVSPFPGCPVVNQRPASAVFGLYYLTCREELFRDETSSLAKDYKREEKNAAEDAFKYAASFNLSRAVGKVWQGRRFAVTESGLMGVVPPGTKEGDIVSVIPGFARPVVLRKVAGGRGEVEIDTIGNEKEVYEYVGSCYIHGIMDGEALKGKPETMTFTIV